MSAGAMRSIAPVVASCCGNRCNRLVGGRRRHAGPRRHEHGGPDGRPGPHAAPGGALMAERRSAPPSSSTRRAGPGDHHRARHPRLRRRRPGPRRGARRDHLTSDLVFAAPTGRSSRPPRDGQRGFRHLVVVDGGESSACSPCATSCAAGPTTAPAATCRSQRAAADGASACSAGARRSRGRVRSRRR